MANSWDGDVYNITLLIPIMLPMNGDGGCLPSIPALRGGRRTLGSQG